MDKSIAAAMMLFASLTGSPATTPKEVVQSGVARVIAVLDGAEVERDRAERGEGRVPAPVPERSRPVELRRIAVDLFDFDEMARRTLSRHWAGRTRAEQAEFVRLFMDLFERAYVGRIESYAGEKIVYLGESLDGTYAVVRSKILTTRGRSDTAIDYRLLRRDGRWRVYDVLIDGISFVSTYRSEFNRVIAGSSYNALVDALRNRRLQVKTVDRRG
ncbi:MAG: MlaC/ttg2D family ABC transporter substrate-binding protein [Gammaproteobacteria bacterium]